MLRDKMLAVMDEVNSEVAERQELVRMIALALLSGCNLFILGAPGQAKSFAVNEFRKRITGARQFERPLSKQTDEGSPVRPAGPCEPDPGRCPGAGAGGGRYIPVPQGTARAGGGGFPRRSGGQ